MPETAFSFPSLQAAASLEKRYPEVFDAVKQATDAAGTVTVNAIEKKLVGSDVTRMDVIGVLRRLERKGLGRFIIGRRGSPSRLEWITGTAREMPADRNGRSDDEEQHREPEARIEGEVRVNQASIRELRHQIPLRPDYIAELRLPVDLTEREAEKLAAFLKSISI